MKTVKLNNGIEMPILGYGVYQVTPEECERCVLDALSVGYRSVDTAQAYFNEEGVGNAISKSGIPRNELFITTKVWISNAGYEKAKASIAESLRKLQSDYVDLLLIHQPFGDYYGTYRAMEEAYKAGKARAIGVSNFYPDRLVDLAECCEIKPAVNQVETHVFNQQIEPQRIMEEYGTRVMSWGPFAEGKNNFFTNELLKTIGEKYGKSVAQVALRYLIQRDVIVIPKSTHKERMIENMDVFDFSLSEEDMQAITTLDQKKSLFLSHTDPEIVKWMINMVKKEAVI
ncbi:aldo/keto reductase [Parabacteroides faecis]|uniref:Diketogulonate reductase-like aldo/keto reductase n=1 Tax=Parabacteroides faecis TaxID=1217282 RepID=A0ABR6KWS4_9BACT|nr:aldo/keto reductase [Parabacteroides faecis]MBB4625243.1 diketogulonate reductase-like aldo/keto reductase [Parabacteroides faecis]GGK19773.1 2,5-diketo-D-gluconic acid reductase [Parabacteroides faecis]